MTRSKILFSALVTSAAARVQQLPTVGSMRLFSSRLLLASVILPLVAGIVVAAPAQGEEPEVRIVALGSRGAIDSDGSLTVAIPLGNAGMATATQVRLEGVRCRHAHVVSPSGLPLALGDLGRDDRDLVLVRCHVAEAPRNQYEIDLSGSFQLVPAVEDDDRVEHGDRDRSQGDDRADEPRHNLWRARVLVELTGTATVSGVAGTAEGPTHRTQGPYPPLPQPVTIEANEDEAPPVPPGVGQVVFAPTVQSHRVGDPMILNYPGITPDGGVGFVVNTSTGAGLPFPMDPGAAAPGGASGVALASGNTFMRVSTDGGATFLPTISNYSTVFGDNPDAGYCCDQVLHYIPSLDLVVWLVQSAQAATGESRERVAWARPADIAANFATAWTWFDLTPGFLGVGANDFLDYPDLAVSDGYLYVSFDDVTAGGLIVTRISMADLQKPAGQTVTWDFTHPVDGKTAFGSHLTQYSTGTMYWAGHPKTNNLQICHWADGSNQYGCESHQHNTYVNTGTSYASLAPDGQYWFQPQFSFDRTMSSVRRPNGEIWFAWNAGRDATFPHPYVAILKVHEADLAPFDEFEIWNPDHTYAYPALGVNSATGEVSVSLHWGGGRKYYQNHAVGFLGDYVVWSTTSSNVTMTSNNVSKTCPDASFVNNPPNRCTRSGDYLGVRRVGSTTGLFATASYETRIQDATKPTDCLAAGQSCTESLHYVVFGRPADTGGQPGIPPPR